MKVDKIRFFINILYIYLDKVIRIIINEVFFLNLGVCDVFNFVIIKEDVFGE